MALAFIAGAAVLGSVLGIGAAAWDRWHRWRAQCAADEQLARALARFDELPPVHRSPLEGLQDVSWKEVGGAFIVPWLLWLQTGKEDGREAWWDSDFDVLVHQYTAWAFTAACAPFLVRVALSPAARHRRIALEALHHLTITDNSSPTADVMRQIAECLLNARPQFAKLHEPDLEDIKAHLLAGITALASRPPATFS